LERVGVDWTRAVSLATDGAPSMIGKKAGSKISELLREFEWRFQVFGELETEFAVFRSPFAVKAADLPVDIQLEIIDLQCDQDLKDKFASSDLGTFYRPKDWYATIYDPVFKTYSLGDLQFNIGLMNDDFSGPAESTRFPLGSIIPIMASVVQETHQPLLLLLEECVAATTPELYPESTMYPIITNKGPKDWYATIYDPVFKTYSLGDLQFNIGLMNDDFSGPAESTRFPLGSIIPIMASVVQETHQPLLLLLEECVAATTPELYPESTMYPIITNKGCLLESVSSRSKFEPRQKSSEIRLSLQTFTFAMGEEVFIHCKLLAWDPNGLDSTKKACHFVEGHGWELLDNLAQSNLCDCCESKCKSRRQRSVASEKHGMVQKAVIGPFTITDVYS
ncbi:hypothetical protein KUCAC02_009159, partial [Chaenocephalus aceratus]